MAIKESKNLFVLLLLHLLLQLLLFLKVENFLKHHKDFLIILKVTLPIYLTHVTKLQKFCRGKNPSIQFSSVQNTTVLSIGTQKRHMRKTMTDMLHIDISAGLIPTDHILHGL